MIDRANGRGLPVTGRAISFPGQIAAITGQITSAQQTAIPEPMTMILFGTGLAGVVGATRRRRRRANS